MKDARKKTEKEGIDEKFRGLVKRKNDADFGPQTIDLCFEILEKEARIIEQCRIAVILSGMIMKGLGKRTQDFLKANEKRLCDRAKEILHSSLMRMEGF